MAEDKKKLLAEIEETLLKADFATAENLCENYVGDYPQDVKAWWFYILANCKACDKKELAALNIDVMTNPVYAEAVAVLSPEKSEKLYAVIKSLNKAKRMGGSSERRECIAYFTEQINTAKAELEVIRENLKATVEENKEEFKFMRKKSAGLYGNSLFGFLMLTVIVFLPFAVVSAIIRIVGGSLIVSLIPLAVAALIVIVRAIIRLSKHKKFVKERAALKENFEDTEARIAEYNKEYKTQNARKKKMVKIYKRLKGDTAASGKAVARYKAEFEKILNGGKKAL